jgi:UDP-N-acetyl-D-galactosamine dehydrogenase
MNIDTESVLEAAGTKWNFLNFRPGLVGGHCIGVDPYYLTYKAQQIGHIPEIILAGRKQNDHMGIYVAQQFIELLSSKNIPIKKARVLVMGLAFKENCPDLRNTKVVDVISNLEGYGINVDVWDTCVDPNEAKKQYNIELINNPKPQSYDGILIAVAHDEFVNIGIDGIRKLGAPKHVIYDLKYVLKLNESDLRL